MKILSGREVERQLERGGMLIRLYIGYKYDLIFVQYIGGRAKEKKKKPIEKDRKKSVT